MNGRHNDYAHIQKNEGSPIVIRDGFAVKVMLQEITQNLTIQIKTKPRGVTHRSTGRISN